MNILNIRLRTDGRKDGRTERRTDGQRQNNIPPSMAGDDNIHLLTKFGEDRMKFSKQTDRLTDNPTDRQSDSYIAPIANGNEVEANKQTNTQTSQQTGQKQYVPHYSGGGHKNGNVMPKTGIPKMFHGQMGDEGSCYSTGDIGGLSPGDPDCGVL
ncbi:hypothetical protein DPMN_085846 [Dreissena polymorpha]|uniref:Uncharacterized protein n=1 Tax=Dreissena polymorpha TaxID=45954 RepID=A0A9D3YH90_DREPO|nr:hypothetical protein DPMN_085846 [Dreissena polymorpha]